MPRFIYLNREATILLLVLYFILKFCVFALMDDDRPCFFHELTQGGV